MRMLRGFYVVHLISGRLLAKIGNRGRRICPEVSVTPGRAAPDTEMIAAMTQSHITGKLISSECMDPTMVEIILHHYSLSTFSEKFGSRSS